MLSIDWGCSDRFLEEDNDQIRDAEKEYKMTMETSNPPTQQCPQCQTLLQSTACVCTQCRSQLGLAAVRESSQIQSTILKSSPPIAPEIFIPRLGEHLVGKGLITKLELNQALVQQQELANSGRPKLLGQILAGNGLISQADLDEVVAEQIAQMKSSLELSNQELESRVAQRTTELSQAISRLGHLDAMKANFIGNVSHELNTPLSHILSYLELFLSEGFGPLSTEQKRAMNRMTTASYRLHELIEDLLQFSTAASGEMMLKSDPFCIEESIQLAVSQKSSIADRRKISLKTMSVDRLPQVYADKEKITWVINHLLDNAIKFTPPNGQVFAYALEKAESVQVKIIDTGMGIPKDQLNELFHPFHQLEKSTTRHHEGLGIGLTMVRHVLMAHGSKICLHSEEGVGTHFAFTLPFHNTINSGLADEEAVIPLRLKDDLKQFVSSTALQ